MTALRWQRSKDENGTTIYTGSTAVAGEQEVMQITSYGKGDFGVTRIVDGVSEHGRYWAEGLAEAKVAAEVMYAGGDPAALHRTHASHSRRSVPPRGSWISIWKWSCTCGEKSSGGKDADGAKSECQAHRIGGFEKWLDEQAAA